MNKKNRKYLIIGGVILIVILLIFLYSWIITTTAIFLKNEKICNVLSSGGSSQMGPASNCVLEVFVAKREIENCGRLRWDYQECEDRIQSSSQ